MATTTTDDRSLGDLIAELTRETSELVRQEMQLAKAEIAETVHEAKTGVLAFSVGAVVTCAGLIVLLFAAVYGMAEIMAPWLAALLVGALALVAGFILLRSGGNKVRPSELMPRRAARSVAATKEYVKEQLR